MLVVRGCVSVVCVVVLVLLGVPVVGAGEGVVPTVVVLDASGSMTETDVDGRSRMDAAKQAVGEFIDRVPATDELGLVTYGTGTGSSEEEKAAGCADISVLAGVGEKDREGLKADVAGLTPRGYTPIGNALRKASELLPGEGSRSIVLVSDGIDTCAPPPVCEVAKELKDQGVDLVVHTIGFMVDDAARAELECIAQTTGGTYADASGVEALRETLTKATTRTAVGYQLPQEVVEFTSDKTQAPMIEPGTVADPKRVNVKVPASDSDYVYAKVAIPDNHRLHVGFTAVPKIGAPGVWENDYRFIPSLRTETDSICHANNSTDAMSPYGGIPKSSHLISEVQGKSSKCSEGSYFIAIEKKAGVEDLDMTVVTQ